MSLPEVRLVLRRAAAGEAGRQVISAQLAALGAGAAAGARKSAEALNELMRDLGEIADPAPEQSASAANLAGELAAAFGSLGIPTASN